MLKKVFIVLGIICLIGAFPFLNTYIQWKRFVQKVKSHSDPIMIQQWAMELNRAHGEEEYFDRTGTNLPPGIASVFPFRPSVVRFPNEGVCIAWGRGEPFIVAGSSNYVFTKRPAVEWIPGVYLCKPSE